MWNRCEARRGGQDGPHGNEVVTPSAVRAELYAPGIWGRREFLNCIAPAKAILGNLMLVLGRGKPMQRDNDYARDLLLRIWRHDEWIWECDPHGGSDEREYYHLRLLCDAGLMEERGRYGGRFRMTDAGHGFCEAVQVDTTWARVKHIGGKAAGKGFEVLVDVVRGEASEALRKAWDTLT